jgi:hypothetical protein
LIPILIWLASEFYPLELLLLPLPVLALIEVGLARLQAITQKEYEARDKCMQAQIKLIRMQRPQRILSWKK